MVPLICNGNTLCTHSSNSTALDVNVYRLKVSELSSKVYEGKIEVILQKLLTILYHIRVEMPCLICSYLATTSVYQIQSAVYRTDQTLYYYNPNNDIHTYWQHK